MNKHFSGKRFYWDRALDKFHDRKTNEDYYPFEDACQIADLLNQYDEENEQLKQFKEKVFNIINKKLQDNEKLDGVDTAMYYANRQTLNELKKELR